MVHKRSALTSRQKMNILVEEGSRRLKNYSPNLDWSEKCQALNTLMIQMFLVDHDEVFRRKVALRIIAKYKMDLSNHLMRIKPMYRTKQERENYKSNGGGETRELN